MNRRSIIAILIGGAALAFAGRYVGRNDSKQAPGTAPSSSSSGEARPALPWGTATVVVFDDGNPASDRAVIFGDAAGAVLSSTKTAKDGSASGPMTPHGMVTVANSANDGHLMTVMAVEPGERIVIGEQEDEGAATERVCSAAISIASAYPNATRYGISVGVNEVPPAGPGTPVALAVLKRFVVDGKVRAVAFARDDSGRVLAYTQALLDGCVRTDAGPGKIAATLPAWSTDFRKLTIQASSQEHGTVEAAIKLVPPGADAFSLGTREAPLPGSVSLELLAPRPLGTRGKMKIEMTYEDGHDHAEIEEERADIPEKTTFALGERLLPRIRDAVVDGQGSARPSVRWSAARSLASADALVARFAWPATREHVWTIVAPPDSPSRLVVPALPDSMAEWRPDQRPITIAVGAVETSFWNGYPDVKKMGLESIEQPPKADVVTVRSSITGDLEL